MTVAKLTPGLPDGSGVTSRLAEQLYEDLMAGKPIEHLVLVGLAKPVGYAERSTEKGKRRTVTLAFDRLEPVADSHDADTVRHLVVASYESRTSRPMTLPLDFGGRGDEEQRTTLLGLIDDWADEEGIEPGDLREKFQDHFGGSEYAPADLSKASVLQLREFSLTYGVIAEEPTTVEVDLPAGEGADEGEPS